MLIPFNLAFLPRTATGGLEGEGAQRVILGVKQ